jgi:hypothetical protein
MERHGLDAFLDPRSLRDRGILRDPEQRLDPSHTAKAKHRGIVTEEWQQILDARTARTSTKPHEQAQAQAYWTERKQVLGITNVHTLDRAAFVTQVAAQTREQALHPVQRPSVEQWCERVQTLKA